MIGKLNLPVSIDVFLYAARCGVRIEHFLRKLGVQRHPGTEACSKC